jgi:hypothetical protein
MDQLNVHPPQKKKGEDSLSARTHHFSPLAFPAAALPQQYHHVMCVPPRGQYLQGRTKWPRCAGGRPAGRLCRAGRDPGRAEPTETCHHQHQPHTQPGTAHRGARISVVVVVRSPAGCDPALPRKDEAHDVRVTVPESSPRHMSRCPPN